MGLDLFVDQVGVGTFQGRAGVDFEKVVQLMLLCASLQDASSLKSVVLKSCEFLLPTALYNVLESRSLKLLDVYDKSKISRTKYFLDVAYMY